MAESTRCHPFGNTVIRQFIIDIAQSIDSSPIVLSSNIHKYFDPSGETVYLKGRVVIIDASVLEIAIFATQSRDTLSIDKYRLHYIDTTGKMIFRYDNAPHHPELDSYPHHKHIPDRIHSSSMPSMKDILNEISVSIIGK